MSVNIVANSIYTNNCDLNASIDKDNNLIVFSDGTTKEYIKARYYDIVFAKVVEEEISSVIVECIYSLGQSLLLIQNILLSIEQDVDVTVIAKKSQDYNRPDFLEKRFCEERRNSKPKEFFSQNFFSSKQSISNKGNDNLNFCITAVCDEKKLLEEEDSLDSILSNIGVSFSEAVFSIIDENNWTDSEVYKRSNISKAVFSNLRKSNYKPSKNTALALCVGLRLDIEASNELLEKAGFILSKSDKTDVIVMECFRKGIYNIMTINSYLYEFNLNLLGVK